MRITPTAAQLVRPALAERVVIPALDSLPTAERDRIRRANPYSYLHALHEPADLDDQAMTAAAEASARGLAALLTAGVFQPGPAGMYVYRIRSGRLTQVSVVVTLPVEEYDTVILPHEKTRPERVEYLARYRTRVGHVSSPVAVAHPPSAEVDRILATVTATPALLDFVTGDGEAQTVWGIADTDAAVAAFAGVSRGYVSDGHHRVAAARAAPGDRDRLVLTALTCTGAVDVLPFHRVVSGVAVQDLLDRFDDVRPADGTPAPTRGHVAVGATGRWWWARLPERADAAVPDSMDAARLHAEVLLPLGLAQADPRLRYVPDVVTREQLAGRHADAVILALAPASFDDVVAAAEAGRTLPLKSTYVRPKPHSGIFLSPV